MAPYAARVLLSDRDLLAAMTSGEVLVDPPLAEQINADPGGPSPLQPASLEVTLAGEFMAPARGHIGSVDPREDSAHLFQPIRPVPGRCLVLHPGRFILGSTAERFTFSAAAAGQLEGKSSLARLGLQVHSTAGFIDPGFTGQITLELSNHGDWPLELWPGMRIGQMFVFRLSSPADRPYGSSPFLGSRYQGQAGPTPARRWRRVAATV